MTGAEYARLKRLLASAEKRLRRLSKQRVFLKDHGDRFCKNFMDSYIRHEEYTYRLRELVESYVPPPKRGRPRKS